MHNLRQSSVLNSSLSNIEGASTPYAIGDVQGCWREMAALLEQLPDARAPRFFLGDLINRGPQSLETLRFIYKQQQIQPQQYQMILGNHDLHFLAVASGVRKTGRSDTLDTLLAAPECAIWVDWLRKQPLAIFTHGFLLVHAGVLPQWDTQQVCDLAAEIQEQLSGANYQEFLSQMYGNAPTQWSNTLKGAKRWRVIVNALTRMRFCTANGEMDLTIKEGLAAAPKGFMPWFEVPARRTQDTPIAFGHWSALGLLLRDNVMGLDTGCVWGGQLSALKLAHSPADRTLLQVQAQNGLDPFAFK